MTIIVGETGIQFWIHRGLLCRASKYFREELSSRETDGGIIAIPIILKEEDPDIFRRFKDWLYSDKIISELETNKNLPWSDIIAIYAFSERRGVPRLQNNCIDTTIRKREEGGLFPGQADINTLWKTPGQVFRLRRLLLHMFATDCDLKHAIAKNGAYHPRFLQGLVQTLYDMKEKNTIYDEVDFWHKRQTYYVDDNDNPIILD